MTSTNINGQQTINKDASNSFKRLNNEHPELNLEKKTKSHFDLGGENGRFHNNKSFLQKEGLNPSDSLIRKIQGNIDDGIRSDKANVRLGDDKLALNLHSALEKIRSYKRRNTKLHFSESGVNLLSYFHERLADKFNEGGSGNDSH
jgi:hypothetical protein